MISVLKNISVAFFLLALVGCASSGRKAHGDLKASLKTSDIVTAVKLVESESFYPEERNKLLKMLELGTLKHIEGSYYQSLKYFDDAKELSDKLFTVSMSKKAASAVVNENVDNYYGEIYERSLIRFYQALNHYLLYQKGVYESFVKKAKGADGKFQESTVSEKQLSDKEIKQHLFAARSVLLEWNSLLDSYHAVMAGESTYKFDLAARVFGAFIHEQFNTATDDQVALNLYKDAKKILFQNYNLYPVFNLKADKFKSDYKKLATLPTETVMSEYVASTDYAKSLISYINKKLEMFKSGKKDNVTFIVEQGYVAEKIVKKIDFKIPVTVLPVDNGILGFASKMLKASAGTAPSITFELPSVESKNVTSNIEIVIKDESGKEIKRAETSIIDPVSDIAYQTLDNKIASTYAKIGLRVAIKHIAALAAAYAVVKKTPGIAGELIAAGMYAGSNKAIAASEEADLRFWLTLPHTIRMSSVQLSPGNYSISYKFVGSNGDVTREYKKLTVAEGKRQLVNVDLRGK